MPTVTNVRPRMMGSTHYVVREVNGRQCLAPESQPENLNFTYLVKLDPSSEQEFYVNVKTKAKSWELPDIDGGKIPGPIVNGAEAGESEAIQKPSPPEYVEFGGTIYAFRDGQYVPQDLPIAPAPLHCWRPILDATKGRYIYENCETSERVVRLPPVAEYCDAVRQLYSNYGIGGSLIDALRTRSGDERRLAEELAIQYGPAPPLGGRRAAREVAECYFRRHDISMIDKIDQLLQEWCGNEIGLIDALRKEHGDRPRTARERVRAIYAQYCPEKLLNCDDQVDQYADQSEELLGALQQKFGPETICESDPLNHIQERIHCQLLKYDPAKAASVDDILNRHRGAEVQLLELLVRYYGPEANEVEREELLLASKLDNNDWADGADWAEAPSAVKEAAELDNLSPNNKPGSQEDRTRGGKDEQQPIEGTDQELELELELEGGELVQQAQRSLPSEDTQENGNRQTNGRGIQEETYPEEQSAQSDPSHHEQQQSTEGDPSHHEQQQSTEGDPSHHVQQQSTEGDSSHHEQQQFTEGDPSHHEQQQSTEGDSSHHEQQQSTEGDSSHHEQQQSTEGDSSHHEQQQFTEGDPSHHEQQQSTEGDSSHHEQQQSTEGDSSHHEQQQSTEGDPSHHEQQQSTEGEGRFKDEGVQSSGVLQSGSAHSSAASFAIDLPSRTSLLMEERRLRELEFQRQQQHLVQAEERLARELDGHRRLIELESEKRWNEDAERVLEIARAAAAHAAREVTLQQVHESREREEDEKRHRLSSEAAAARIEQLEAQLREALAAAEKCAQRDEQLCAENARLIARIAEVRRECDLELRGMRIHLDDVRVRAAALRGEQELRALRQREGEAAALAGLRRELDLARAGAAAEKSAMQEDLAQREAAAAALRGELECARREAEAARAAAESASARAAGLERLSAAVERARRGRREQSAQAEAPGEAPAQGLAAALVAERDAAQGLAATLVAERDAAQGLAAALVAERDAAQGLAAALVAERDAARAEVEAVRRRAAAKIELRRLATPDGDAAAREASTREDLGRANRSLAEAHAEAAVLKREIRDLRSLLAVYMSNARRPVGV